jgi:TPR repeat protein
MLRKGIAAVALALTLGLGLAALPVAAGPLEDAQAANSREDYTTALPLFRSLADQGNATAQYELGLMYRLGQGVPQDFAEGAKWYRRAADQGLSLAQFGLGMGIICLVRGAIASAGVQKEQTAEDRHRLAPD